MEGSRSVDEYETLMFINLYICHVEGSEIIKVSGAAKYNNVSWLTNNKRSGGNPRAPEKSEPRAGKRWSGICEIYITLWASLSLPSLHFLHFSSLLLSSLFIHFYSSLFLSIPHVQVRSFTLFSFLLWNNMDEL